MITHSDSPACWDWPLPSAEMLAQVDSDDLLWFWQEHRCAACGNDTGRLVEDHDHFTGLVRGYLCRSCNIHEGFAWKPTDPVVQYRQRNPATILGVETIYVNIYGETPLSPPGHRARMSPEAQQAEDEELQAFVERALSDSPRRAVEPPVVATSAPRVRHRVDRGSIGDRCGRATKAGPACRGHIRLHADACGQHMTAGEQADRVLANLVAKALDG